MYPDQPGFKESNGTSQAAAEAIAPAAATLRESVVTSLRTAGPGTADQIATRLGQSVLAIRPRFSELNKTNAIRKTDRKARNASGKMAVVWELT